ncbi:trypsin-like peptidase domain-containing protein [Streptomyces bottropensis]|uniref:trypsin-like peptidase domain-containing protein n=1 Tax=Streptomyces bottropensis TaxID=42235 RepID=UPI00368F2A3E
MLDRLPWQVRISPAVETANGTLREGNLPSGGGVWIGARWILTCAHVVGDENSKVLVRFAGTADPEVPAHVREGCWVDKDHGDLALLELSKPAPKTAQPAPLRPGRSTSGHHCVAYGYPKGHDDEGGVRANALIEGAAERGWLQLSAQTAQGHAVEKGFSGSGLYDTEAGVVVGVVVARDLDPRVKGSFAIPMQKAVEAFEELRPWVGWRLGTDPLMHAHWWTRARGVYHSGTLGYYFTGRTKLLRELVAWLKNGEPGSGVRVVTGPAGTGKSAVLGWLAALSDPELYDEIDRARPEALTDPDALPGLGRISAALWARGLDAAGAARALAEALSVPLAAQTSVANFPKAIRELYDTEDLQNLVVVVDELDQAEDPRGIASFLAQLDDDLGMKVLVGTRSRSSDELLDALGTNADPVVYSLVQSRYFNRQDVVDYAAASLRLDFGNKASGYRKDSDACAKVAEAIADSADGNFLVAGLTGRSRAKDPVIDTSQPGWASRQRFPRNVRQAFQDYLDRYGDDRHRAKDLLRALAYAEGPGLPNTDAPVWLTMANSLSPAHRYDRADVAWLLEHASDYLIGTDTGAPQPLHRLFHQALAEHLRPPEQDETWAQRKIVSALRGSAIGPSGLPNWATANPYIRRYLAAHAAHAGSLDDLVTDAEFLIYADPNGLMPHLHAVQSQPAQLAAAVYCTSIQRHQYANPETRRHLLAIDSARYGAADLRRRLTSSIEVGLWQPRWATGSQVTPALRNTVTDHEGEVLATEWVEVNGEAMVVAVGDDGKVRMWDPITGDHVREELTDRTQNVVGVACAEVKGSAVAVTVHNDGALQMWNLMHDHVVVESLSSQTLGARAVACTVLEGKPVAVIGSADHTVRVWNLNSRSQDGPAMKGHGGGVGAVVCTVLDGRPVAITGDSDGTVRAWDLKTRRTVKGPLTSRRRGGVKKLACTAAAGATTAVALGNDRRVRVWQLNARQPVESRLKGSTSKVIAVACTVVRGQPVAITGRTDGKVQMWNLKDRGPMERPLTGHQGQVTSMECAVLGGQPVAITGGQDGTVRLWDVDATRVSVGRPKAGHTDEVTAVACATLDRRSVAVSGSEDGTVRVWDLRTGELVHTLTGHTGGVRALATTTVGSRTVIATLDSGRCLHTWDSSANERTVSPVSGCIATTVACTVLNGQPVAVTGSADGTLRVWQLVAARHTERSQSRHGGLRAMACTVLDGQPVAATGGDNGTIRIWNLDTPQPHVHPVPGPPTRLKVNVCAIACTQVNGLPVAVTRWEDDTDEMWTWELTSQTPVELRLTGHTGGVRAVACNQVHGRPMAVTSGRDATVRVWDMTSEEEAPFQIVPMPASAEAIALGEDGTLVVGTGNEVVVLERVPPDR